MFEIDVNKKAYTAKDPCPPPRRFLYLTETKSWRCEGKGKGNVHLLTHASARGVGKNVMEKKEEDKPWVFFLDLNKK